MRRACPCRWRAALPATSWGLAARVRSTADLAAVVSAVQGIHAGRFVGPDGRVAATMHDRSIANGGRERDGGWRLVRSYWTAPGYPATPRRAEGCRGSCARRRVA